MASRLRILGACWISSLVWLTTPIFARAPDLIRIPFLQGLHRTQAADIDDIALGKREFSKKDAALLTDRRQFLQAFLGWYANAKTHRPEEYGRLFDVAHHLDGPDALALRYAARVVVVWLEYYDQAGATTKYLGALRACLSFLEDCDRNFGCSRTCLSRSRFLDMEREVLRQIIRHLGRDLQTSVDLEALAALLKRHFDAQVPFVQSIRDQWELGIKGVSTLSESDPQEVVWAFGDEVSFINDESAQAVVAGVRKFGARIRTLYKQQGRFFFETPLQMLKKTRTGIQTLALLKHHLKERDARLAPVLPAEISTTPEKAVQYLLGTSVPNFAGMYESELLTASLQQGVLAMVELMRFKKTNGAFPPDLASLTHSIGKPLPKDPVTGRDFTFRKAGGSFLLYGAGMDGEDHGGEGDWGTSGEDLRIWPRPFRR